MARSTSSAASRDPENLVENLRSLIAEAEKTIAESATDATSEAVSDLRSRLESAKGSLEDILASARQKVTAGAKQADATIRSHPYESLAIALGVGVLLGAFLRKN